jgi:hypothetical protein
VREFILAFGDDSTDDGLDWGLEAVVDNNMQVNDVYGPTGARVSNRHSLL